MPLAPTPTFYAANCNPAFLFPTCANLHGNLGRNTLIGPGVSKLDFSVFKNNPVKRISESFNVQFRAEVFNVLNHTNFSSPTDNLNVFDQHGQPVPDHFDADFQPANPICAQTNLVVAVSACEAKRAKQKSDNSVTTL